METKINILTTFKNVTVALKKLKDNTIFKSPKYMTDQHISIVNDYAFCSDNAVQTKDEIRLILANSKASRMYYKLKIYVSSSLIFQRACIKFFLSF